MIINVDLTVRRERCSTNGRNCCGSEDKSSLMSPHLPNSCRFRMSELPCIPPIIDRRNRGLDGYQQFRLAREKFRLDLFDKRFAVFSAQ